MEDSTLIRLNLKQEYQSIKQKGFSDLTELCRLMSSFGSDKGNGWHNYTIVYHALFSHFRNDHIALFELGIGTTKVGAPSSMGPSGKPGASLRAWRAYFPNSQICAADIDRDVLFEEDRIRTYWVDQRSSRAIRALWDGLNDLDFDIMIDDGLHQASANIRFFLESFRKLKPGGIYVIEDINTWDVELLTSLAKCAAHACRCVLYVDIPHTVNRIDNRLIIFQKA